MGMLRVSSGGAVLEAAFFPAGAVVGPFGSGAGLGGGQVDPAPAAGRQHAVGFAQGDRLGGAQRGVVQAAEERLQVLAARALSPDGRQEPAGLGRVCDRAAVDGLGDRGGLPLDPVEGVGGQQPQFDGVAEGVGEHGPLAAGGGRGGGLAVQPPGAGVQDGADGGRGLPARPPAGTPSRSIPVPG